MMKKFPWACFISLVVCFWLSSHPVQAVTQQMEASKAQKEKELSNLEGLAKIVADEIATARAEMAQNMSTTVQKVGKSKANPEGLVTTDGGVMHSPSQHWKLDVKKLRQEYQNKDIYTKDEIETIVEFHQSYVQNQGFTAGIAEQLAKVAEGKAQQRTLQKYISKKKQEIKDLENAPQGNDSGGGGGGGGY
jgi:hypothetical protein